jgi:ABC-type multidrug transport system ATPase subunit/pSer/pThr/pTyr-binding forkhead associated (FHA) protein
VSQQPDYPALFDLGNRQLHPLRGRTAFLVGRSETADLTVLDVRCSRQQFRLVRDKGHYHVESLSHSTPTLRNGQPVTGRVQLAHKDEVAAGNNRFLFLARPSSSASSAPEVVVAAEPEPPLLTVLAGRGAPLPAASEVVRPIRLSGRMFIGRDADRVEIPLDHPHVSRVHAQITLTDRGASLVDLDSANGTFVNGQRIRGRATVLPGDQIDIGPYALEFDGDALLPRSRSDNVELVARRVRRVVTNRETGKPLTLLEDVTLVIRPREFVCLLGPSGSGKTTLLSVLSGRTVPDEGRVLVNGQNLHANFDALKQDIAVVPQKDILHDSLSVGGALWYTARLRLPPDLSAPEVDDCIAETLETVNLTNRRGTLIRDLSGGQVKRASLANEIMCKPSLLFLDEVTSGLDEQTDQAMMELFRSVADAGKTVVCITHSLANVESNCHVVVILTPGGRLAFMGKPEEALGYFKIHRLGDVYKRLEEEPAEYWQEKFEKSPFYDKYITDRLPKAASERPAARARPVPRGKQFLLFLRQTALLARRYFAIWRGNKTALLAMLGQSLLVAVLLGILFGNLDKAAEPAKETRARAPATPQEAARQQAQRAAEKADHARKSVNLLFLLAVTAFWFGCNNAAKEIVKERSIYTRERDFNIQVPSYYFSKFLLLVLFSGLQALLLAGIVKLWCGPPGNFVGQCWLLGCLAVAGVTLGLAISALASSEEMAITLIPVAIIPQIILSGVIAPLSGLSKFLAQAAATVYWGNRGLDGLLSREQANNAGIEQGSFAVAALVVLVHAGLFLAVCVATLFQQGRRGRLVSNRFRPAKSSGRYSRAR